MPSNFSQPLSSTYLSPSLSLPAFLSHTHSLFRRTPTGGKYPTTPGYLVTVVAHTYLPLSLMCDVTSKGPMFCKCRTVGVLSVAAVDANVEDEGPWTNLEEIKQMLYETETREIFFLLPVHHSSGCVNHNYRRRAIFGLCHVRGLVCVRVVRLSSGRANWHLLTASEGGKLK